MANETIRDMAKQKHVSHWRIAEVLGIHEAVLSRMMRHELSPEEQKQILSIIEDLTKKTE